MARICGAPISRAPIWPTPSSPTRAPTARNSRRRSCPTASARTRSPARVPDLEAGRALVGAGAVLAGHRIVVALARLAQEARVHDQAASGADLLAVLLDEHAADRS